MSLLLEVLCEVIDDGEGVGKVYLICLGDN